MYDGADLYANKCIVTSARERDTMWVHSEWIYFVIEAKHHQVGAENNVEVALISVCVSVGGNW